MKKIVRYTLITLLAVVMVSIAPIFYALANQHKIIFDPKPLHENHEYVFHHPHENFVFEAPNNGVIHATLFTVKNPKGVVLYCHGQRSNIQTVGKRVCNTFCSRGYDVMVFDYRGFGKSTGSFNEEIFLNDGLIPYSYLKQKYGEKHLQVYGVSLGTGPAAYIASKTHPNKLILESPYFNLQTLARYTKPIVPDWLVEKALYYRFTTDEYLSHVTCPVYIIHGTADDIIPYEHSLKLVDKHKDTKDIYLYTISEGEHNTIYKHPEYHTRLNTLLDR